MKLLPVFWQIRGNAPYAQIVVVGLPDNVVSSIRSPETAQAYSGNVTTVIRELKDSGFQRLNFLGLPPSVKQVPLLVLSVPTCHTLGFPAVLHELAYKWRGACVDELVGCAAVAVLLSTLCHSAVPCLRVLRSHTSKAKQGMPLSHALGPEGMQDPSQHIIICGASLSQGMKA